LKLDTPSHYHIRGRPNDKLTVSVPQLTLFSRPNVLVS
jgi:hypothetical protein